MIQHQFPELPFAMDALQPHISSKTIDFHYNKHHRGYFDKMLKLLPGSGLEGAPLDELVKKSEGKLFNQAAQFWNHCFYWKSLTPQARPQPDGKLMAAIQKKFGTFREFVEKFETIGTDLFGSGWVWLVFDSNGEVDLLPTSNADNPLRHGKTPLFVADVWEHAYYLDYQNARAKHLQALWQIVNWQFAQVNYEQALTSQSEAA